MSIVKIYLNNMVIPLLLDEDQAFDFDANTNSGLIYFLKIIHEGEKKQR